jgi:hypothetical protein
MAKKKVKATKAERKVSEKELQREFNNLAIIGFVLSCLSWFAVIGIPLDIIALVQIKRKNHRGKELAIAGIIIGVIILIITIMRFAKIYN